MADIPPVHASAIQAGYQAREVGKARDARRDEQARAASQQIKSASDAAGMVDTTDVDNQVFTDAEGAGSQGRAFEESPPAEDFASASEEKPGIVRDAQGQLHLDLEA